MIGVEATLERVDYEGGDERGIAPTPVYTIGPPNVFDAGDDVYVEEIDETLTVCEYDPDGYAVARRCGER